MRTSNNVRAIILNDQAQLVLLRRTRPDRPVYWVLPGGGVEDTDASLEAAMHREVFEEMGATVQIVREVVRLPGKEPKIYYLFLCSLLTLDPSQRNGPEFSDPDRGLFDIDLVASDSATLAQLNLRPESIKGFLIDFFSRPIDGAQDLSTNP